MLHLVLFCLLGCSSSTDDSTSVGDGGASDGGGTAPAGTLPLGGDGTAEVTVIEVIGGGGLLVGGSFTGTLQAGGESLTSAGGSDGFLLQLDGDLQVEWALGLGGSGDDRVTVVLPTSAGAFVGGEHGDVMSAGGQSLGHAGGSDGFVAAVSSGGSVSGAATLGDGDDETVRGLVTLKDGGVAVMGAAAGSAYQVWIEVLDASLAPTESVHFVEEPDPIQVTDACPGPETELFGWTGSFTGDHQLGAASLSSDSTAATFIQRRAHPQVDNWTMKLDVGGQTVTEGLGCLDDGGFFFAGWYEGGELQLGPDLLQADAGDVQMMAGLANEDGEPVWARTLDSSAEGTLAAAGVGGDLMVAVGDFTGTLSDGSTTLTAAGSGADVVVAAWNAAGDSRGLQALSSDGAVHGQAVAVSADGTIYVGGSFTGSLAVGSDSLSSDSGGDGYVVALGL